MAGSEGQVIKFYIYDPGHGFETFDTAEEAEKAARELVDDRRGHGEWPDDIDAIEWGEMSCRGLAKKVNVHHASDDDDATDEAKMAHANGWSEWCDYKIESLPVPPDHQRIARVEALLARWKADGSYADCCVYSTGVRELERALKGDL